MILRIEWGGVVILLDDSASKAVECISPTATGQFPIPNKGGEEDADDYLGFRRHTSAPTGLPRPYGDADTSGDDGNSSPNPDVTEGM